MDYKLEDNSNGVTVWGFYKHKMRYYFTCLNQSSKTTFELNFDLDYNEAISLMREKKGNTYIQIVNPNLETYLNK